MLYPTLERQAIAIFSFVRVRLQKFFTCNQKSINYLLFPCHISLSLTMVNKYFKREEAKYVIKIKDHNDARHENGEYRYETPSLIWNKNGDGRRGDNSQPVSGRDSVCLPFLCCVPTSLSRIELASYRRPRVPICNACTLHTDLYTFK